MKGYVYRRPEGTLHKVSGTEWNKVFGKRGRGWANTCEIYVTEAGATIYHVPSKLGLTVAVLLFPILYVSSVLIVGVKDANNDIACLFNFRKRGSFSSDDVLNNERHKTSWEKIQKLIDKSYDIKEVQTPLYGKRGEE
tara:strand:+ start:355 stop:768 length:414 start_codon:yes stop_codon:yes gene_type:complete